MVPNQVMGERVLDGGGRFSPVSIFGLHTLCLLLASLLAHDRATEDNHTHHTGRVSYTNIILIPTRGYSK